DNRARRRRPVRARPAARVRRSRGPHPRAAAGRRPSRVLARGAPSRRGRGAVRRRPGRQRGAWGDRAGRRQDRPRSPVGERVPRAARRERRRGARRGQRHGLSRREGAGAPRRALVRLRRRDRGRAALRIAEGAARPRHGARRGALGARRAGAARPGRAGERLRVVGAGLRGRSPRREVLGREVDVRVL
ncbi:MAG: hypothetical protein AVDCRST_MAG47-2640, partial [uncultured Nocardioidaceae bacterium]